jgi:hypothetical protein
MHDPHCIETVLVMWAAVELGIRMLVRQAEMIDGGSNG